MPTDKTMNWFLIFAALIFGTLTYLFAYQACLSDGFWKFIFLSVISGIVFLAAAFALIFCFFKKREKNENEN